MIGQLAIVGVGLIGGSLARALRAAGAVGEIVGYGRGIANLQQAVDLGVIDRVESSAERAVRGADMVVLALPVGSMAATMSQIGPQLRPQAVVTDVGSVKGSIVTAARAALGGRFSRYVPGHPIAGTEKSGVAASFAELFHDRRVVLTPVAETDPDAIERVRAMWQATGAQTVMMEVGHHDEILAATSHLPHLLAYCLVDTLARMDDSRVIFDFAAGGFRDFTRIAASDPVMWRDICLGNRAAILSALGRYRRDLDALMAAIGQEDGAWLQELFTRAKRERDALSGGRV
ncbi:MAG: prephenate dehydrogenase/arogenate dehydrogenase family protein [Gammaproteobacteria bacterium]|nr:prephenate dehydrogenase/arogenate dehydrogenase family protein [Gammaproteobacteria bacterium]